MLRGNCLLKQVPEGKVDGRLEVAGIRGRRSKQLLYDLEERGGCWKLEEEAADRTLWRTGFVIGCGHVVRRSAE